MNYCGIRSWEEWTVILNCGAVTTDDMVHGLISQASFPIIITALTIRTWQRNTWIGLWKWHMTTCYLNIFPQWNALRCGWRIIPMPRSYGIVNLPWSSKSDHIPNGMKDLLMLLSRLSGHMQNLLLHLIITGKDSCLKISYLIEDFEIPLFLDFIK